MATNMTAWTVADLAKYCEHCMVIAIADNDKYCDSCANEVTEDLARKYGEQSSIEQGWY